MVSKDCGFALPRQTPRHNLTPLQPSTQTASFFLPGLVHQFGNLLLTMQGHVLHVEPEGIKRMQDAVRGAVSRGGASLQVVRVLLGEQTNTMGSAHELVMQVVELGRVPGRECGVSLEFRGDEPAATIWVHAGPFVFAIAETLRHWISAVRTGSSGIRANGTVTVTLRNDNDGMVRVRLGYEPAAGSLPFPMPAQAVAKAVSDHSHAAGGSAKAVPATGSGTSAAIELSFAASETMPSLEA